MVAANQARALEAIYRAAIARVEAGALVRERLVGSGDDASVRIGSRRRLQVTGDVWLVAAGKCAIPMSAAATDVLDRRIAGGVIAAPVEAPRPARGVECFVGGHPLPDEGSVAAGRAIWRLLDRTRPNDTVLLLLSGGASSLLALPAPGVTLADKVATTRALLASGASIAEINAVRKHLSRLKGGGLARRAAPARVVCLLLSDVIGSSPAVVGSGPAAADPTTYADALAVLRRRELLGSVPPAVLRHLERGRRGAIPESLKPGESRARHVVVGDVLLALDAARGFAESRGYPSVVASAALRGDTRRAAERFAQAVVGAARNRRRACILAGGETTVRVGGGGRGGRNQEFALVLARAIAGAGFEIACLSAGSDGVDGPTDAAGAFVDGTTIDRARAAGLDPARFLADNDSYSFFDRLGDLFRPGPTATNVMDLKIALVTPARAAGRGPRRGGVLT